MLPALSPSEREHYESLKRIVGFVPVPDPLLDGAQAAAYVRWSRSTLDKSRLTGDGPGFIKVGRLVRYRKSDLDAWLASRHRRSTSDAGAAA